MGTHQRPGVVTKVVSALADPLAFRKVDWNIVRCIPSMKGGAPFQNASTFGDVVPEASCSFVEVELERRERALLWKSLTEMTVAYGIWKPSVGIGLGLAVPSSAILETRNVVVDWLGAVVDHGCGRPMAQTLPEKLPSRSSLFEGQVQRSKNLGEGTARAQ